MHPILKNLQSDEALVAGSLVFYEQEGKPFLAFVTDVKKNKYQLLNFRGREVELPINRIHPLPAKLPNDLTTTDQKTEYLNRLSEESLKKAQTIDIAELWALVREEASEFANSKLCELYYGNNSLHDHLALKYALLDDPVYFKRKKDIFFPRTAEVVEELLRAEETKKEKVELAELAVESFKRKGTEPDFELAEELLELVSALEDLAVNSPDLSPARRKEAKEFIDLYEETLNTSLPGTIEKKALKLLQDINVVDARTNPAIIKYRPRINFSNEAKAAAEELVVSESAGAYQEGPREDLTGLHVITIDDESTKDMDDGLSLEKDGDGYILGIHITDVAAVIKPDSVLDHEVKSRATSIYCPERTIHMLPRDVSQNKLSLIKGEIRPALSCLFKLDKDYAIKEKRLVLSLIKVAERLSYNQVDEMLEQQDSSLLPLYNIAVSLETKRIEDGANKVYRRDVSVNVAEDGEVSIVEIDENGPARSLVGEMMILANCEMAEYAARNSFPVVFRGQQEPHERNEDEKDLPTGPAADYQERTKLKRSEISFTPSRHSGLGVKAYIQCSSPIRRYVDLINQRQIENHLLHAEPLYSAEDLEQLLVEIDQPLRTAAQVSRDSKKFWLLRYLAKLKKTQPVIKGTVLRTDLRNPLVELDQVHMPLLIKLKSSVKPGDEVNLKIVNVDPYEDYIRLEEVE